MDFLLALMFPPSIKVPRIEVDTSIDALELYYAEEEFIQIRDPDDKYALVHGIGHHNYTVFPKCESYLTEYAETNTHEDFAESFTYFYFYRDNFRSLAAFDTCLLKKYRVIYRLFNPRNV